MTTSPASIDVQPDAAVPGRDHYDLAYIGAGRIHSFAHQIATVLGHKPAEVLEVGVGSGCVAAALRALGISVVTLDVQPELRPDVLGSVTAIPMPDKCIDVAVCCQVLEHLPFAEFQSALTELRRVARRGLVLSLPDASRYAEMRVAAPLVGRRGFAWSPPRLSPPSMPPSRWAEMGHHWEIGYRGYGFRRVCQGIQASGWKIIRDWRVYELPWHHFFDLR